MLKRPVIFSKFFLNQTQQWNFCNLSRRFLLLMLQIISIKPISNTLLWKLHLKKVQLKEQSSFCILPIGKVSKLFKGISPNNLHDHRQNSWHSTPTSPNSHLHDAKHKLWPAKSDKERICQVSHFLLNWCWICLCSKGFFLNAVNAVLQPLLEIGIPLFLARLQSQLATLLKAKLYEDELLSLSYNLC